MSKSFEEMQLIAELQQQGINYDDSKEGIVIVFFGSGDNMDEITGYISLRTLESGTVVASVFCYDFFSFQDDINGYLACNKANDDALVAKFYIDEDGDAIGTYTGVYKNGFSAQHLVDQLDYFAVDMDDAYPFFVEAKQ